MKASSLTPYSEKGKGAWPLEVVAKTMRELFEEDSR